MKNRAGKKHIFWNTLGSAMYGANSFIMLALVSRIGTIEQAGDFGIAFTTAQILYIIGLLGVSHYQMTDYDGKYPFSDYVRVRMFSCCLMAASAAGAIFLLGFEGEQVAYTAGLTTLMLLNVVGDLYQCLFFQKNRLDLSGAALFHRTLWPLLVFCIVLMLSGQIVAAIAAQTVGNLLLTWYFARAAKPFLSGSICPPRPSMARALAAECLPLFFSLLLMNLVINASKYGVEFWMDGLAQGYYNMIFMPVQVINLCSQFLFKPFLNQYAKLLQSGERKPFFRLLGKQLSLIGALTVICCAGAYWLGAPVLGALYQKDLHALAMQLTLVVLGGGLFAACQLFYYVLVILRQQKAVLRIYILAAVVSAGLTALLVRQGGLTGAAMSLIAVHILLLLFYIAVLLRVLGGKALCLKLR